MYINAKCIAPYDRLPARDIQSRNKTERAELMEKLEEWIG